MDLISHGCPPRGVPNAAQECIDYCETLSFEAPPPGLLPVAPRRLLSPTIPTKARAMNPTHYGDPCAGMEWDECLISCHHGAQCQCRDDEHAVWNTDGSVPRSMVGKCLPKTQTPVSKRCQAGLNATCGSAFGNKTACTSCVHAHAGSLTGADCPTWNSKALSLCIAYCSDPTAGCPPDTPPGYSGTFDCGLGCTDDSQCEGISPGSKRAFCQGLTPPSPPPSPPSPPTPPPTPVPLPASCKAEIAKDCAAEAPDGCFNCVYDHGQDLVNHGCPFGGQCHPEINYCKSLGLPSRALRDGDGEGHGKCSYNTNVPVPTPPPTPAPANECHPSAPGGCSGHVCEMCCNDFISDGAPCDECVTNTCPIPVAFTWQWQPFQIRNGEWPCLFQSGRSAAMSALKGPGKSLVAYCLGPNGPNPPTQYHLYCTLGPHRNGMVNLTVDGGPPVTEGCSVAPSKRYGANGTRCCFTPFTAE